MEVTVRNVRSVLTAVQEMMGVWVVAAILCLAAVVAFGRPASRTIGMVYGLVAVVVVLYALKGTREKVLKRQL